MHIHTQHTYTHYLSLHRRYVQEHAEGELGQIELFLNSVPLLSPLHRDAKLRLVDAFAEEMFAAGSIIIREGDPGDKFYIVKRCAICTVAAV